MAVMATVIIGFVILIMNRFDWYGREVSSQLLKIQVANNVEFDTLFIDTFAKFTDVADLISVDTVRSGMLTELIYNVSLKRRVQLQEFLSTIKQLNGNQKVTLITGYNNVDL
ncbi:hypothetical protein MNBD_CHLOROFLEXI01-1072 [hydrothermal vent metagenome]|uniref:Uncharacterized protein n=1 Tax=hydrothermal vent metagenome TaxID=652676 RepID=A0A3B0VWZ5_9ZZZZ